MRRGSFEPATEGDCFTGSQAAGARPHRGLRRRARLRPLVLDRTGVGAHTRRPGSQGAVRTAGARVAAGKQRWRATPGYRRSPCKLTARLQSWRGGLRMRPPARRRLR